ncbi:HEAT repeat domain-containing protein [Spirulina major CS-329]|uniref:HEAT repeat domain-containing protein n=1 Tax=Spirulina TaxID=1154 RepID=UPI00232CA05C|nr:MULTISPECIES: HEAT repeat domain-containing protein [Spirulina]MDB9494912.1 HEAT repeat domain-containing protein [Spirulina subsalsa CS-330]MDB9504139.1 HEAT repeat domain-containing protein [Spirulina major CS-329]
MNDSSNLQPSGVPESSLPPLNNAQDLINAFYGLSNAGDQVELFFAVAESRPGNAFPWFVTILKNRAEPPLRALALQGLGHITDEPTRADITSGQSDYSIALLHLLAEEIRGSKAQSNDLTRWAAAWAIEQLRFSRDLLAHVEGGALTEPPERIRREIVDRKLDEMERVDRLNSRGNFTADYERHLEFWLYAGDATVEFLNDKSTNRRFLEVAGDIINLLFVRGILLGVESPNRDIQKIALEFAKQRFTTSEAIEQRLYESLKGFLTEAYNDEIELRRMAAQVVIQAGDWLDRSHWAKAAIICEQWDQVRQVGEVAVPTLEQVIWKVLRLSDNRYAQKSNLDYQDIAIALLSDISFKSLEDKVFNLVKILLHPDERSRETVARTLEIYEDKVEDLESGAFSIVEIILFKLSNFNESEFNNFTIQQLSDLVARLNKQIGNFDHIVGTATFASQKLGKKFELSSSEIKAHLNKIGNNQLSNNEENIEKIKSLSAKISDLQQRIYNNQTLLRKSLDLIKGRSRFSVFVDSRFVIEVTSFAIEQLSSSTYNECMQESTKLNDLKFSVIQHMEGIFEKQRKQKNSSDSSGCLGCLGVIALLIFLSNLIGVLGTELGLFTFAAIVILIYYIYQYVNDLSSFKKIVNDLKQQWS